MTLQATGEETRNRLLRRADWRFLLPDPNPIRSICFDGGAIAEAVRTISTDFVDGRSTRAEGDCDLAVALNPDRATLQSAWSALRPGGACYVEWYGVPGHGPPRVIKRLEEIGFGAITCYAPRPNPSRALPTKWVPLQAAGAVRHFVAEGSAQAGSMRRVARSVRRLIWLAGARFRIVKPIATIAQKPNVPVRAATTTPNGSRRAPGAVEMSDGFHASLLSTIRANWSVWDLGETPARLSLLLLTGGRRSINKVVGLVFGEPDPRPRLVVKIPRVPDAGSGLEHEADVLRVINAQAPDLAGVPRLLFQTTHAGIRTIGQTALTGTPIAEILRPENCQQLAMLATVWQASLARRSAVTAPAHWWTSFVQSVLIEFERSFGPVIEEAMLLETVSRFSSLGPLPMICEHRDFSPWNTLVSRDGGSIGVLDWESAELRGVPALDLIYFLTYLGFYLDGAFRTGCYRESYRALLHPASIKGGLARDCHKLYAEQLELDESAIPALRLLTWLIHSRSDYRHLTADAGGEPSADMLRSSLFLALWEEELRHDLPRWRRGTAPGPKFLADQRVPSMSPPALRELRS